MSFRSSAYFPSERLCGYLLPSITKLVTLSLAEGVFTQKFKKAIVTPLIKKACVMCIYETSHSTKTALLYIKHEIHLSLSHGEPTALVLLDLLAAFIRNDHTTLYCFQSWFGV